MFKFDSCKVLVTCCNLMGGLYEIYFDEQDYHIKKILEGDCRGIAKYSDNYVLVTNSSEILLLDFNYQTIKSYKTEEILDLHGVAVRDEKAYVVETRRNAVGVYRLPDLVKIEELRISQEDYDVNHVNDICIDQENIYVSMFSSSGEWRKNSIYSGLVKEYSLLDLSYVNTVFCDLKHPHSVIKEGENILYCNSADFEVMENKNTIFRGLGYTRGLAANNEFIYIGQSESRNIEVSRQNRLNISLDCGINVFNIREKVSRFITLPSKEVYAILVNHA
ncbi:DUF4915 domain-containing protein [Desulforamulus ruminis]|uniref:DUF4915 domain-containing protein n=1 Tax=Desulforamulus ruminis TaxID=1564 RepID=UPI0023531376|nr:DUF4915 domain-containing protein [Desulforamulus ruminis]